MNDSALSSLPSVYKLYSNCVTCVKAESHRGLKLSQREEEEQTVTEAESRRRNEAEAVREARRSVRGQSACILRESCARSLFKRGINPGYITNPDLNGSDAGSVSQDCCFLQACAPQEDSRCSELLP